MDPTLTQIKLKTNLTKNVGARQSQFKMDMWGPRESHGESDSHKSEARSKGTSFGAVTKGIHNYSKKVTIWLFSFLNFTP